MKSIIDTPTHLTTLRGKGGWGTTQKLLDVFWVFTSGAANSVHISTLLHFYVAIKNANEKTDAAMNVKYGFPLNTFAA